MHVPQGVDWVFVDQPSLFMRPGGIYGDEFGQWKGDALTKEDIVALFGSTERDKKFILASGAMSVVAWLVGHTAAVVDSDAQRQG